MRLDRLQQDTVHMDRSRSRAARHKHHKVTQVGSSEAGMATPVLKPQRTIAIVDDDPGMQASLSGLLDARGYATAVFSSAEEWLERGGSVRADCMLIDVWLGGMSGIELQRRLRASGLTVPVIFMTGRYDEATRLQAPQAGGATLAELLRL